MSLSSYNGHSNFTINGKKFIKRGADNIYDIASVAGTSGNFSTGWVQTDGTTTVNNGADLNFNHNLGTTDLTFAVYVADDASGTNATLISTVDTRVNPYVWTGAQVQNLTTTSFRLRLGGGQHSNNQSGYTYLYSPTGGQNTGESYTGKYIKVIASAGGGGGGFLYDFSVSQGSATNKWGSTTTWYFIDSANIRKLDSSMPDITQADIMTARGASMQYGNPNRWTGGNSFATITINGVTYNMSCPFPGAGYILKGPVS